RGAVVDALVAELEDVGRVGDADGVVIGERQGGGEFGVVEFVAFVHARVADTRDRQVQFGAFAQFARPAGVEVDLVVDAVVGVAEVHRRCPGTGVEAAGVRDGDLALQGRIAVGLGDAAPYEVADPGHAAFHRPDAVVPGLLGEGEAGRGGEGEQQAAGSEAHGRVGRRRGRIRYTRAARRPMRARGAGLTMRPLRRARPPAPNPYR